MDLTEAKETNERGVPKATLERYPVYLKALHKLHSQKVGRVLSKELAGMTRIESTTIRRDFSFLGRLGKQGYGYDVERLIGIFEEELGVGFDEKIILVGCGNLGRALTNYNHWDNVVGEIVCGFDLVVPRKTLNIPVYPISELNEHMPEGCRIAILAVSTKVQETVDLLIEAGICGIVDFTHEHISAPPEVIVKPIDVVSSIQALVFETNEMARMESEKKEMDE
ncbi:MAG: redox-sensing transcriptional repressor Rex [Erysipelotrichaceae bacterium]|jgi:redox-sensing transcriptional repressor|nr:redox-sensing transcriptional repressor Rex [Erysipelotrichaceae bacterium]